jgi:hypothetical protein
LHFNKVSFHPRQSCSAFSKVFLNRNWNRNRRGRAVTFCRSGTGIRMRYGYASGFCTSFLLLKNCPKYCLEPEPEPEPERELEPKPEPEPKLFQSRNWNHNILLGFTALPLPLHSTGISTSPPPPHQPTLWAKKILG